MQASTQPKKPEAIQRLRNEFHRNGWETKQLHKFADVYMVYKPNALEYCYFVAYISAGNGSFKLLPEKPELESYQEAKEILGTVTYEN